MRYFGLLLAFATFCVGLHLPAQAQSDMLIVPGVRIGPVNLGTTYAEIYKRFGDPGQTSFSDNDAIINYFYPGFVVTVEKASDKIIQVTTSDPKYATASGIKVGISRLVAAKKLGVPAGDCDSHVGCNYWSGDGLWLDVAADQNVKSIWVVPTGK